MDAEAAKIPPQPKINQPGCFPLLSAQPRSRSVTQRSLVFAGGTAGAVACDSLRAVAQRRLVAQECTRRVWSLHVQQINRHTIDARIGRVLPRSTYASLKGAYRAARDSRAYSLGQALARRNPGRGRLLPDFLIVGSMKCGTTSIHGWLNEHPFVVAPTRKDTHFFSVNYRRRVDWYRCFFPYARDRERFAAEHGRPFVCGEATASYLAHYWTPRRAAKLVPNVRLIACLREPVDRAYSQYHYFRRWEAEPLDTFEEAIASEGERLRGEEAREIGDPRYLSMPVYRWGYLRTSRYDEHVERWLEVFPREQILFLKFEDVVAAPERALERMHEHLGLPPHPGGELPALNAGTYEPMAEATRERLREYFRPHNERLRELTGIDFGWS